MEWYTLVFLLIDMRSFSSLWYWIALAVLWSSVSHWVMGVPFDLITRARRQDAEAVEDLTVLARINARRMLYISRRGGMWVIGFVCFVLTVLGMLAGLYRVEFAQAVLLMAGPMVLIGYLTLRLALRVEAEAPAGAALVRLMMRHRFVTQLIGMIAIFVTALFGMYHNIT
ncbi:MAG: component of SufBCD complex [Pseudotabrizicola sp.]|uniref:component of SufBCD complex n=1 Tax=Pseudotabrizicola sp. TaxID=2939647 RepID=UPI0027262DC4|nr:component of SufBCD complex [Pseudotabrizicola sp.]MDO9638684.1 component of SufBCD complex [Pseudotabrizicola sp.]